MREKLQILGLGPNDIDDIMMLERKVCIPLIQASEETILKRFGVGNTMLGVRLGGALVGSIGFRYGNFSPDDRESFVKTFRVFSTPSERPSVFNSGFVYSVNVDPEYRTLAVQPDQPRRTTGLHTIGIGRTLIVGVAERMKESGCIYLVGDGRPAFYNGSYDFPHERYEQVPRLRELLDKCAAGHTLSSEESAEILAYPIFKAYNKFLGGGIQVAWVLSNFFPTDTPTGGFRVILYKHL